MIYCIVFFFPFRNPYLKRLPEKLGLLQHLFTLDVDTVNIVEPVEVAQIFKTKVEGGMTDQVVQVLREKLLNYQQYNGVKLMIIGPNVSGISRNC